MGHFRIKKKTWIDTSVIKEYNTITTGILKNSNLRKEHFIILCKDFITQLQLNNVDDGLNPMINQSIHGTIASRYPTFLNQFLKSKQNHSDIPFDKINHIIAFGFWAMIVLWFLIIAFHSKLKIDKQWFYIMGLVIVSIIINDFFVVFYPLI